MLVCGGDWWQTTTPLIPMCRHGEMQAIREACSRLGTPHLHGCVLYTSAGAWVGTGGGRPPHACGRVLVASRRAFHPYMPAPRCPRSAPCPTCACIRMWGWTAHLSLLWPMIHGALPHVRAQQHVGALSIAHAAGSLIQLSSGHVDQAEPAVSVALPHLHLLSLIRRALPHVHVRQHVGAAGQGLLRGHPRRRQGAREVR